MEKIDLVIPTYNRPDFLNRILDYYKPYAHQFRIIVADSSFPENKRRNKIIIKKCGFNALHLDKFSPKLEQHYKFALMVKEVKSKYCFFCADDDFIVPNGVIESVKFLDKNPDYVTAHGTYISFYILRLPLSIKKFIWRFLYPHISITNTTSTERAGAHLRNYTMALWGVHRSDVIKACFRDFAKTNINPKLLPVLGELLPDTLIATHGKIKRLKVFYSARQCFSQVLNSYPSLFDAKKIGVYDQEISKFKNCIIKSISPKNQSEKCDANTILDQSLEVYHKASYQEHLMGKINKILKKSPNFISQSFSAILTIYLFSKPKNDWIGFIDKPTSKYYSDFNEIRSCVLSHI